MQGLRSAHHIPDGIRPPRPDAVVQRREVRRGVQEAAVRLPDDAGVGAPFPLVLHEEGVFTRRHGAVGEYADGAVAFPGHSGGDHAVHQRSQGVVVKAFPQPVVKVDVKLVVDFGKAGFGDLHAAFPDRQVFRVPGLELHQLRLAGVQQFRLFPAHQVHVLVHPQQLVNGVGLQGLFVQNVLPAPKDHAELGAPVPDVVVRNHVVPHETGHAGEGVPDDGGADVAHMHRLGDVGRGKVNDDGFGVLHFFHPQPAVRQHGQQPRGVKFRPDAEVDEAGSGNFQGTDAVLPHPVHYLLSERAGVRAAPLGKHHGGVALVVPEPQIRGGRHRGAKISGKLLPQHRLQRGRQLFFKNSGYGHVCPDERTFHRRSQGATVMKTYLFR